MLVCRRQGWKPLGTCRGMLDPNTWKMIDWPAGHPPLIVVVVDTEAEDIAHPGSLSVELERDELHQLRRIIQENIGTRPRIYKAGRYGVGHSTARILTELGYEIDLSVVPHTDLSPQFGPDFSRCG